MRLWRLSNQWLAWSLVLIPAIAVITACGGEREVLLETVVVTRAPEVRTEVQTVVVEKEVPGERVVETVVVEREVPGETVIETVVITQEKIVEKEVVQTVIVERDKVVEKEVVKTVEKEVVVTATPTAVPSSAAPGPKTQPGSIVIATNEIRIGGGLNRTGRGQPEVFWGAAETLFTTSAGPRFGEPWLIKSWEPADDVSKVTMTVQDGVEFHGGFGELNAADVVWSVNDANSAVTPESVHPQADDLAAMFGEWQTIDDRTLEAPFTQFDVRWQTAAISDGWRPTGIWSKTAYDQNGAEWMRDHFIGTGPFEVLEWVKDDRAILEARENHWMKTPQIRQLTIRAIPDDTTGTAALKTGEVDAAGVASKDIPDLLDAGFVKNGAGGGSQLNIAFSGNFLETEHALTGESLGPWTLPAYEKDYAWIGAPQEFNAHLAYTDTDNPPNMTDMEQARLVRQALAISYDRQALSAAFEGGINWPTYIGMFDVKMPQWSTEWNLSFDPDRARDLLAQAGYSDGFEISIFGNAGTVREEIAQAIAEFWEKELGLTVTVEASPYSVFRPTLVDRTNFMPWVTPTDSGRLPRPWDWPAGQSLTSMTRGGFSSGVEIPFLAENFKNIASEPSAVKRLQMNLGVADYLHEQALVPGVFTQPAVIMQNPRSIQSWEMRPAMMVSITSPENIVPAR